MNYPHPMDDKTGFEATDEEMGLVRETDMSSQQITRREIVCITRHGFNFLHTEGEDFAAKVTHLEYTPGEVYDPRDGVKQELLIPRYRG